MIQTKEILQGLKVIHEIIQGDLKWFGKHCTGKEDDSVAQVEEVIKEVQKKFQELHDKKMLTKKNFLNVAHIEAMLIINLKHLEMHEENMTELKKEKEIQKQRLAYIGLPHQSVTSAFSTAYEAWKATRSVAGVDGAT